MGSLETRGRKILATELLKDGYHERAERVAAGNEFMSDEPAVRACVEAVGGAAQGATAVGLLVEAAARFREYEAHHRARVAREAHNARYDIPGTAKGGSLEKAERNAEIAGRIEAALALPSPVRQGEDGGVTRSAGRSAGPADPSREDASRPTAAAANARSVK